MVKPSRWKRVMDWWNSTDTRRQIAIDEDNRTAPTRTAKRKAAAKKAAKQLALTKESTMNSQQLLLENLRDCVQNSSYVFESDKYKYDTSKYILPYYGPPEDVVTKMINPPNSSAFLHATPAQLSMLEPLLRFFLVDNDGNQKEVYFSDHTSAKRTLKLASLRRGVGVDELLSPRDQRGSDVGIKSFSWNYHNKHEGDRIITAKLELYFGTLTELVNLNYLQFLFTNGRKSSYAPPLKQDPAGKSLNARLKLLEKEVESLRPSMTPGGPVSPKLTDKADFRQLKVAVGWSVPKGSQAELRRQFAEAGDQYRTANQRYENFVNGIESTQKIILLSMKAYDVDFSQEGPTTLTIEYVGSTDQYINGPASDVLGKNNFSPGALNQRQVQVSLGEVNLKNVYPEGYVAAKLNEIKEWNNRKDQAEAADGVIYVRMDRLKAESDVLSVLQHIAEIKGEIYGNKSQKEKLAAYTSYQKSIETLYFGAQRTIRSERYAQFIDELLGQGNSKEESRIFTARAIYDPVARKTNLKFAKDAATETNIAERLRALANLKVKEAKQGTIDRLVYQNTFDVEGKFSEQPDRTNGTFIPFIRFGDIVRTGMRLAGIREDVKLILGSITPGQVNARGYTRNGDEHVGIYDIPIALDYFSQYFFDNVIQNDRDEYPFRQFFDDLVTTLGRLLNDISNYKLRVSFDYTLYTTNDSLEKPPERAEDPRPFAILTPETIENLSNDHQNFELFMSSARAHNYYILFAKQSNGDRKGNRVIDETNGVYHYTLGASRGLAKNFNFSKQDVPQFQAMNIEQAILSSAGTALSQALILPQNVSIEMVGNSLHRNGDMIYVDSRAALGTFANQVLALGGYYRVVRSNHSITPAGYTTTVDAMFQERTGG